MSEALEAELLRQFKASDWETAKDVMEGLDMDAIQRAAQINPEAVIQEVATEREAGWYWVASKGQWLPALWFDAKGPWPRSWALGGVFWTAAKDIGQVGSRIPGPEQERKV